MERERTKWLTAVLAERMSQVRWGLFDLDNTLYPRDNGVNDTISQRIHDYMAQRLGMDDDTIASLRKRYMTAYGATMRGLALDYGVDPEEYLEYVHRLPVAQFIQPSENLDANLRVLPWEKVIFTSSTREHTQAVLTALGISHHFGRTFDIRDVGYVGKPAESAYRTVLDAIGAEAERCVFLDDSLANVRAASRLGMRTVLVGAGNCATDVDLHVARVEDALGLIGRQSGDRGAGTSQNNTNGWESE